VPAWRRNWAGLKARFPARFVLSWFVGGFKRSSLLGVEAAA
jgi:hypothetical protein